MAEPPYKRSRRPDSKQMWEEQDRRAPLPTRERDEPRDFRRREDRDRDRDRRYRSRSPRDSRTGRNRGGRERERDYRDRDSRGSGRRDERGDDRSYRRDTDRGGRRERDRDRDEPRDGRDSRDRRRDSRSRSPRKETKGSHVESKRAKSREPLDESKERTATPPVSFKVGGQDHDRMDVDGESNPSKRKNAKVKNADVATEPGDDEDVLVEDDGMADMQAMMGFGGFGTTQQKKVAGNDIYAVRKEKKTEYRQYMNRVGGFNRPLSPTRQ